MPPADRIDHAEVRRVAALARLHLSDEETASLTTDLGRILGYVGKLSELDTSSIEPTSHVVEFAAPLREDAVTSGGSTEAAEAAVAGAPRRDGTYFVVPRILE
jgi:aspartyl-tRNA(Asn)/glutamyl-tRNA(Gln) amidotransferase subunit C